MACVDDFHCACGKIDDRDAAGNERGRVDLSFERIVQSVDDIGRCGPVADFVAKHLVEPEGGNGGFHRFPRNICDHDGKLFPGIVDPSVGEVISPDIIRRDQQTVHAVAVESHPLWQKAHLHIVRRLELVPHFPVMGLPEATVSSFSHESLLVGRSDQTESERNRNQTQKPQKVGVIGGVGGKREEGETEEADDGVSSLPESKDSVATLDIGIDHGEIPIGDENRQVRDSQGEEQGVGPEEERTNGQRDRAGPVVGRSLESGKELDERRTQAVACNRPERGDLFGNFIGQESIRNGEEKVTQGQRYDRDPADGYPEADKEEADGL